MHAFIFASGQRGLSLLKRAVVFLLAASALVLSGCTKGPRDALKEGFLSPPDTARPGVYWYFMDGNISREAMTVDLESMKEAGIGWVLFLEVNVGIPRGPVDFLNEEWQVLFEHAVRETERLGIHLILGSGPGWAGSGGPWVTPAQSMKHLLAAAVEVRGAGQNAGKLPVPDPRRPFFGPATLTPELKEKRDAWYEDVAVLAFPTPPMKRTIALIDEKALYDRAPYTSQPGVLPYLPPPSEFEEAPGSAVDPDRVIDLTDSLNPDGTLAWEAPPGDWTVMRFVARNNGAVTRPAPLPGLGFECDKFDRAAFDAHYDAYIGKLVAMVKPRENQSGGGWTMIHIDSWEMGAQNWSDGFREEFERRRGYDPLPYLPAYAGFIVGSLERSERFLWDLRRTSSELIVENHALRFKELGRREGFTLSIEPYDMNPAADLDLGAVADVPMGEFWSDGFGFNSSFSAIEAVSIAHADGAPVVAAEAFTADRPEAWKKYPGNMKNQTDWAFCVGLNRLIFHTFVHNPLDKRLRPGMTMGPYGVHWDRGQTWWPLVPAYHRYVSRCQHVLSQGKPVADILYLAPEGAPQVFRPPASALEGTEALPDKRAYSFDGCSPLALMKSAAVENGRVVFPGGASYSLLVLPAFETMTPELLAKVEELVKAGAVVAGAPPRRSPSLENYPACDAKVAEIALTLWGRIEPPAELMERAYGLGKIFWGGDLTSQGLGNGTHPLTDKIYPNYSATAALLEKLGARQDFSASGAVRYVHRSLPDREVYFLSNRTDKTIKDTCIFRDGTTDAELWDAVSSEIRPLCNLKATQNGIALQIVFEPYQSFFIIFDKPGNPQSGHKGNKQIKEKAADFPAPETVMTIEGPWTVKFDPAWGGPERVVFDHLIDWTKRPEEGIRYYSGIAVYSKDFALPEDAARSRKQDLYLNLGKVSHLARVKLNGRDLEIVWTAPWQVKIRDAVRPKRNHLEIEVANLWINRLIGDEQEPWDGIERGRWPQWVIEGSPRPSRRFTFTTNRFYKKDDPLVESGLIGPVCVVRR
jgi:hypothetical protein